MSMKALEWAMYHVPAEMVKGALLRILLALADHADTEGRGAFPSQRRLVALTGYSRRTIQNGLHALEAAGLIVKGDQKLTAHYHHRTVVWDLTMTDFRGAKNAPQENNGLEAQHTTPQKTVGAQLGAQKTATRGATRGAICLRPNLYKEEPYIEPRESNAREKNNTDPDRLETIRRTPGARRQARHRLRHGSTEIPGQGARHRHPVGRLGREIPHLAHARPRTRIRHRKKPKDSPQIHMGVRRGQTHRRHRPRRHRRLDGTRVQGRGAVERGRGSG